MSPAYAAWSRDRYGWAVDPADVRPVADVVAALTLAIEHFSAPGTPVVLPTPAYMPFLTVPPLLGREVIAGAAGAPSGRYDLDALDAAFAAGGDLLILCNPHNPVGRVLTPGRDAGDRRGRGAARRRGCSPTRSTRRWCSPATGTCRTRRCRRSPPGTR